MVIAMADDQLSITFAALADPTRRAILARLARGEATVSELAEPFDLSLPTISKHLKVLQHAGLISQGRRAQWRPCRLEATLRLSPKKERPAKGERSRFSKCPLYCSRRLFRRFEPVDSAAQVLIAVAGGLMTAVIGNNMALAFALVGLGGFIRFRSGIKDPREAGVMFIMIGIGMACGIGQMPVALTATVFGFSGEYPYFEAPSDAQQAPRVDFDR